MEKDKDGFYYIDCGGFGHNSRIGTEVKGIDVMVAKGVITQEVAHPAKKSYPGSDGARIPISLEDHLPERSEQYRTTKQRIDPPPPMKVLTPEGVKLKSPQPKSDTELYLDHFLGKDRTRRFLEQSPDPAPAIVGALRRAAKDLLLNSTYEDFQHSHVGRGLFGINDMSGLEDQFIMYCTAIDHGSFDHKLSRSSTDRAKVLRLIRSARGNVIKYIGRTPRGVVFMTTYKESTVGHMLKDPMKAYRVLHRDRKPEDYRLDYILSKQH